MWYNCDEFKTSCILRRENIHWDVSAFPGVLARLWACWSGVWKDKRESVQDCDVVDILPFKQINLDNDCLWYIFINLITYTIPPEVCASVRALAWAESSWIEHVLNVAWKIHGLNKYLSEKWSKVANSTVRDRALEGSYVKGLGSVGVCLCLHW